MNLTEVPSKEEITDALSGVDPVLNSVMEAVELIYERTFWAIGPALIVHRCLETLAKRGKNVDMLTFLMGPGGVGLSLITAHMVAMYGVKNHKYFDPNIFSTTKNFASKSNCL